jgi:hypothetical protein
MAGSIKQETKVDASTAFGKSIILTPAEIAKVISSKRLIASLARIPQHLHLLHEALNLSLDYHSITARTNTYSHNRHRQQSQHIRYKLRSDTIKQ